ncbi:hypothetical protein Sjap_026090 [Stephania japonica]|uniref:Uncharacterized protein n=1 Tax=Stephania japonica TaxID=461633 RepID=A0AAP0HG67_9MAGN
MVEAFKLWFGFIQILQHLYGKKDEDLMHSLMSFITLAPRLGLHMRERTWTVTSSCEGSSPRRT